MRITLAILTVLVLILISLRAAQADDLADAKAFIGKQIELIKKGDVDALKATFTDRLKEKITKEQVDKAAKEASKHTLDELVDKVSTEGNGLKIKMKGGRSLTTLVKVGASWRADTIWFK